MNPNTREDLKAFINAIEELGYAVSSICGTDCLTNLIQKSEQLKAQLDKDETIP